MAAPQPIQVSVTDAHGHPLEGATVFALVAGGQSPRAHTDSSGLALLQLPPGSICRSIAAFKNGAGFDYRLVWKPHEIRTDPYRLPPDLGQKVHLLLEGARSVKARVRDPPGRPVAGARVGPCSVSRSSRGSYLFSPFEFTHGFTDDDGIATFNFIQQDLYGPNHFTAEMDGWEAGGAYILDEDTAEDILEITLFPLVPVSGRVCNATGSPVAGASVHATAAAVCFASSERHTTTASDGTFRLYLPSDRLCVIFARHASQASLVHTCAVTDSPPPPPFELVLGTAPHLAGRVTVGSERAPVANAAVSIEYRFYWITARGIRDSVRGDPNLLFPHITLNVATDSQANFEVHTAPGLYTVACELESQKVQELVDITLSQVSTNLHFDTPRPIYNAFSGRVVNTSGDPMPYATVAILTESGGDVSGTADSNGCFTLPRPSKPFFLVGISGDKQMAGELHMPSAEEPLILPLAPAASAAGRLIHTDGTPVTRGFLWCSSLENQKHTVRRDLLGMRARPDADGRFLVQGLFPHQEYALKYYDRRNNRSAELCKFRVDHPRELSLGDQTLPNQ